MLKLIIWFGWVGAVIGGAGIIATLIVEWLEKQ